ncbi:MAG TPA: hypothetical protein VJ736_03050 [Actinomycetota bacterium]|jgi:hypothetical protein|nr:hypothetical protein [Actinomycetota bacterium]
MPEPTKVWMVQLDRSPDDVEGTLTLEGQALRFDSPSLGIRSITLTGVERVKRIWGSPVLLVRSVEDGDKRVTAFYFSKPPPLHPQDPAPDAPAATLIGPFNRNRQPSRRKQRRRNAGYLANASNIVGDSLEVWVKETRAAVAAARGNGA